MENNRVIDMKRPNMGPGKGGSMGFLSPKNYMTHQNRDGLYSEFTQCLSQSKTEIILDCKSVSYMDSEGLELLVRMNDETKKREGTLKVINLNPVCRDILIATRLINTLHVYKDMREAIKGRS